MSENRTLPARVIDMEYLHAHAGSVLGPRRAGVTAFGPAPVEVMSACEDVGASGSFTRVPANSKTTVC